MEIHDIVIIGSGPAAYTAAIYAARAMLKPLVIASSVEAGGELMKTTDVENFPGFPDGIQGPELMELMRQQAEKFGSRIMYEDVTSVSLSESPKSVTLGSGETLLSRTVIIATGSAYRKLGIVGEEKFAGKGVSWCATCDGFFFKEKKIIVVGGGDSALEEALFLTRFADKVHIVHRRDTFRASKIMQERVFTHPKIEILFNTELVEISGNETASSVTLSDTITGEQRLFDIGGIFVAIGNDPRTHLVHGQLELTSEGTISVSHRSSQTSIDGVFAAGDVIDPHYRQAITAAASGTVAALDAEQFLAKMSAENSHREKEKTLV